MKQGLLWRRERPTSARLADQTVERDWRQAMPRAEPALSLATLPLLAVVGPPLCWLGGQLAMPLPQRIDPDSADCLQQANNERHYNGCEGE